MGLFDAIRGALFGQDTPDAYEDDCPPYPPPAGTTLTPADVAMLNMPGTVWVVGGAQVPPGTLPSTLLDTARQRGLTTATFYERNEAGGFTPHTYALRRDTEAFTYGFAESDTYEDRYGLEG